MDGTSLTPQEIKLQEIKKMFPEVFAEDKIDWEKLKATLDEDINFSNERYVLNWAGKSDARYPKDALRRMHTLLQG